MSTPTVTIDEPVWAQVLSLIDEFGAGWTMRFALRTNTATARAERALHEAVLEVDQRPGFEASRVEWEWIRLADHLVIVIEGDDTAPQLLTAVSQVLGRRGISGAFTMLPSPRAEMPGARRDMLACRLRIRGERAGVHHWRADRQAYYAAVDAALAWSGLAGGWLGSRMVGWIDAPDDQQVRAIMRRAATEQTQASYAADHGTTTRYVSVWSEGGMSLLVAAADGCSLDWGQALNDLLGVVRECAGDLAYAAIMRGSQRGNMLLAGTPESGDWPQRPQSAPVGAGWTRTSFEDLLAPDAYGAQWFGQGYRDRPLNSDQWETEDHGVGRLVISRDTAAWFSSAWSTMIADGDTQSRPRSVPPILERARRELDAFLCAPGRLTEYGFAQEDGQSLE